MILKQDRTKTLQVHIANSYPKFFGGELFPLCAEQYLVFTHLLINLNEGMEVCIHSKFFASV